MTNPFDQISEKNKERLFRLLEADTLKIDANKILSSLVKSDDFIGIIIKGYIQIRKIDYNGNRIIIDELEENQVFGNTLSSLKNNEYEILAKEETSIILMDYDRILKSESPKEYYNRFIKNLLKIISEKVKEQNARIEILTKRTIRNKLLEYFRILSQKQSSKYIYLPFNFTDLADYLAVDRSAMSRELRYLKEEGFIEIKGKKITLLYEKDSALYQNL